MGCQWGLLANGFDQLSNPFHWTNVLVRLSCWTDCGISLSISLLLYYCLGIGRMNERIVDWFAWLWIPLAWCQKSGHGSNLLGFAWFSPLIYYGAPFSRRFSEPKWRNGPIIILSDWMDVGQRLRFEQIPILCYLGKGSARKFIFVNCCFLLPIINFEKGRFDPCC